jgi:hypothetical protein
VNLDIGFGPDQNKEDNAMDDFSVLIFVPDTGEFLDFTKYDVHDVIDRRTNQIVGEIFINKETGKEELIQLKNGKVRRLSDIHKPGMDS